MTYPAVSRRALVVALVMLNASACERPADRFSSDNEDSPPKGELVALYEAEAAVHFGKAQPKAPAAPACPPDHVLWRRTPTESLCVARCRTDDDCDADARCRALDVHASFARYDDDPDAPPAVSAVHICEPG